MECFTLYDKEIKKGITVSNKDDLVKVIYIGGDGPKSKQYWIALDSSVNVGDDNTIYKCDLIKNKKHHYIIVNPHTDKDTSNLALVKLYFLEGDYGWNHYEYNRNHVREICRGFYSQGKNGENGGGYEILVIMKQNSQIICKRGGILNRKPREMGVRWFNNELITYYVGKPTNVRS